MRDKRGTVAFTKVNGRKIFGVNSSLLSDESKNLGRGIFKDMKEAGYFSSSKFYGSGSAQVLTHAEANSLMRAFVKSGRNLGSEVTIYVDRLTCGICDKNLSSLKEFMGVEKLNVVTKSCAEFTY